MLFADDASGEEFVVMTVDPNAITYLHERDRLSKMIVTTANKPSPLGWAARYIALWDERRPAHHSCRDWLLPRRAR